MAPKAKHNQVFRLIGDRKCFMNIPMDQLSDEQKAVRRAALAARTWIFDKARSENKNPRTRESLGHLSISVK